MSLNLLLFRNISSTFQKFLLVPSFTVHLFLLFVTCLSLCLFKFFPHVHKKLLYVLLEGPQLVFSFVVVDCCIFPGNILSDSSSSPWVTTPVFSMRSTLIHSKFAIIHSKLYHQVSFYVSLVFKDPAGIFELIEVVGNGTYGQVYKVCVALCIHQHITTHGYDQSC